MDKAEYKQMCESHGLRMVSDIRAVGMERGYLTVVQYAGKNSVSVSLPAQKGDRKTYAKELKAKLREAFGKSASAAWADQGYVTVFLNTKDIPDVYCQGVTAALDILKNLGFTVPDSCSVCGKSGCDCAVPRGAAYTPVHRACLEGSVAGAQAKAEKNARGGSYLLGALGAFLGAVVGVLPSALTILVAQRIYVLLFIIIPLASYAGYRLLKGRMNYVALILSIVFSVLGVYLLNFAVQLYYVADYYAISFSDAMSLVPAMLGDPEMWLEISKDEDFIKCILFVAVGIFLAWGQISRTSKTDVKDAQGVLSSAVPYGQPQPDGFAYDPADYLPDSGDTNYEVK